MKIICLGFWGYFRRRIHQYEAFLALMTTINTAYSLNTNLSLPLLLSFPVLRIIRLVKLSPTLENFVYKVKDAASALSAYFDLV